MAEGVKNPLLSSQKSSDSGLQVTLHPLPVLEISDYITRGYQRGLQGAIVGGLLGQQNGREITVEHSFTVRTEKNADGFYEFDSLWFSSRLEQMKAVHQNPPLDLVGWYSLVPHSGPSPAHLPLHNQFLVHNESAILLGFHVEEILHPAPGDPLPLTIYESNLEADDSNSGSDTAGGEDKEMKDPEAATKMTLRFRELPYTTETGEAEMIAMQFIREGGANAMAGVGKEGSEKAAEADSKGKGKAAKEEAKKTGPDGNLTKDELEFVSALQMKASAIKMMKSRVDLVVAYLSGLPPAFVAGQQSSAEAAANPSPPSTVPSNNLLRQIQALVTNIHLVTPAEQDRLGKEIQVETNDVRLIGLISDLMASVNSVRDVGKKFAAVEAARNVKLRNRGELGPSLSDVVDPIQLGSQAGDLFT